MSRKIPRVLVVATSEKTRGGITSVVKAHRSTTVWKKFRCRWIETQIDRSIGFKIAVLIWSYLQALIFVPFCDIVHFHTVTGISTKLILPIFLLVKAFRKKCIIHLHVSNQLLHYADDGLLRYVLGHSDLVLTLSQDAKRILLQEYEMKVPVTVLYNPCPKSFISKEIPKEKWILVAGILDQNKDYATILKAFQIIKDSHPDWRLKFAGNGEIELATRLAVSLQMEKNVDFLGWVQGDEKALLFQQASIYCLASYKEGFPMAVLEAWSYGLPVICTPVGGLNDVVVDAQNVLLFDPGDFDQLASKMSLLIKDLTLRISISEASQKLAETTFSLDAVSAELDLIYQNVWKNKK